MKRVIKKAFSFLFLMLVVLSLFFLFRWIINGNKNEKNNTDDKQTPPVPSPPLPPSLDAENWWLTDEEITYAYQKMEKELGNSSEIKLVSPSEVRFFQEGGEIREDLKQEKIIFFPINNSESHETGDSGSHWTLLVGDNRGKSGAFSHYNSAVSAIPANARKLAEKFCEKVGVEEEFLPPTIYNDHDCPQQTNGSDCGVFVIAFTRALIREYKKNAFDRNLNLKEENLIFTISEERQKLKDAGFPKKVSDGGSYDIGDDVEYLKSEEKLISQWWPKRDEPFHPSRKCVRNTWNLDIEETGTPYDHVDNFKKFSKKVRKLSGIAKLEKEKSAKIYRIKRVLKACSLPLEEYKKTKSFASKGNFNESRITDEESKFIKENINKETVKEIEDLYKIHFPEK